MSVRVQNSRSAGIDRKSVLVDARALYSSGIGRYLREILGELLADPRFERITILGSREELSLFLDQHKAPGRAHIVDYPPLFYSPRVQLTWLLLRARGAIRSDVAFFPHYDAPLIGLPARSVVTVHDLTHFIVPDAFGKLQRIGASILLGRVVAAAQQVIVVSEATRRDLVERIPEAEARTQVVANGVTRFFAPLVSDDLRTRAHSAPRKPFLLCVGNRKPHKNLLAAVEVLALLKRDWIDLQLVITGREYPGWSAIRDRAIALGVDGSIIEQEGITDATLRDLYTTCEAFLFPSFYEGFGLPALEAMACGAPVIASDRGGIPEVVGNGGILVDPRDYRSMAEAVRRLRSDPEFRNKLTAAGRARAACFTWAQSAKRSVEILYRVASGELN